MGGERLRLLATLGAAVLALVLASPAQGVAGTKCKAGAVSGAGLTEDLAVSNWSQKARRAYGAAWANFGLARGKSASQTALPAATMYFVTATPCRRT